MMMYSLRITKKRRLGPYTQDCKEQRSGPNDANLDANAPAPSMHAPRIDDRTGPRRSQFSSIPILAVAARLSPSLLSTRVLLSHRRSSPRSLAMDPARRRKNWKREGAQRRHATSSSLLAENSE